MKNNGDEKRDSTPLSSGMDIDSHILQHENSMNPYDITN